MEEGRFPTSSTAVLWKLSSAAITGYNWIVLLPRIFMTHAMQNLISKGYRQFLACQTFLEMDDGLGSSQINMHISVHTNFDSAPRETMWSA